MGSERETKSHAGSGIENIERAGMKLMLIMNP
jgi:hypothetical protein